MCQNCFLSVFVMWKLLYTGWPKGRQTTEALNYKIYIHLDFGIFYVIGPGRRGGADCWLQQWHAYLRKLTNPMADRRLMYFITNENPFWLWCFYFFMVHIIEVALTAYIGSGGGRAEKNGLAVSNCQTSSSILSPHTRWKSKLNWSNIDRLVLSTQNINPGIFTDMIMSTCTSLQTVLK